MTWKNRATLRHKNGSFRFEARLPAGVTPLTASDGQLAPYVDRDYQSDGSGNPTEMIAQCQGCSS